MESSYGREYDISNCLPLLLEKTVQNYTKEIKNLYVAMSRPKHLLCLAVNKAKITEKNITELEKKEWKICKIDCQ